MQDLEPRARIMELVSAIVADHSTAATSCAALISTAAAMAAQLHSDQRRSLAAHMVEEAARLTPVQWH
jgi:uncharacterized tellurite resistance protein B-like protein